LIKEMMKSFPVLNEQLDFFRNAIQREQSRKSGQSPNKEKERKEESSSGN
jgi:hypothetical protein